MKPACILMVAALSGALAAESLANCPAEWLTDVILCDDFDSYCEGGGHPMQDPKIQCAAGAPKSNWLCENTWLRDPKEGGDGTELWPEDQPTYLTSGPFGGRYPCQGEATLGQMTIRNWEDSPLPLTAPDQIRNMVWLIQRTHGEEYDAVSGTDAQPLAVTFLLNGLTADKIDWGNGYVELTMGDERANTDYNLSPDCNVYCDPPIANSNMPIMCAQGNPEGPLPSGCPDVVATPPPVRASIAVGVLGMMDYNPCHCGNEEVHGPRNYHLNIFDGRKWWMLKQNLNAGQGWVNSGSLTLKKGPMPPPYPDDLSTPGHFELNGASHGGKAHNWVTLTIRTDTFKVELTTQENDRDGNQYYITSVMDNIPREYKYTGPEPTDFSGAFDSVRIGVGAGCPVNGSWTCTQARNELRSRVPGDHAGALIFDDFVVYGGEGYSQLGACCLGDGTCVDGKTQPECTALGGAYRGPSTTCGDGSICLGACCRSEVLGCADTKRNECPAPFTYMGEGTSCSNITCPCSDPFADADLDGDVDQADFAVLQACFLGPGVAVSGTCKCFDRTDSLGTGPSDGYVDQNDVAKFEVCASGPGIPLDPDCDN